MVYLDYNATTPLDPEVVEVITETLTTAWGNPSSSHEAGVKAKHVIATARQQVARMVGAKPSDIIFTSGGTEGNNWILQTALQHFCRGSSKIGLSMGDWNDAKSARNRPHFITSNIEHDSIKLVLEHFLSTGLADVTFIQARPLTGCVHVQDVIDAIGPSTIMVTVMLANNETGVIQPVSEICQRIKSLKRKKGETERILLHTDAAQAIGKIPVDVQELGVDYLTIVGHKFYGPRIGAVFAHNPGEDAPLYPLLFGGGQERNFRSGTENTPMIAGLGKAAELVSSNLDKYQTHMATVRDYLEESLQQTFPDSVSLNGKSPDSQRLPNTCNVSFLGTSLKGHEILSRAVSVQASVGAACHAGDRPSHILLSLGIPETVAWRALRISVGRETTKEDIDLAVQELKSVLDS
ncbi:unnamed protein product [Candidula unifasciata]|uniref:Selenocysteine lyase n=1 Tax=Candidula unifasciata TaxID=100452 RepID=A0A8S3YZV9_9EUPU|nr:unnamed protein product [Candidula unifasciata]